MGPNSILKLQKSMPNEGLTEKFEIAYHLGRYYQNETTLMDMEDFYNLVNSLYNLFLNSSYPYLHEYLNQLTHLEIKTYIEILKAI